MKQTTDGVRAIILASILLCITISLTGARAVQEKNGGLRVATVDVGRLYNEYSFTINTLQELQKREQVSITVLRTLAQHALLSEADQKALADLVTAEATSPNGLTPEQKTKKQQLLDKSKAMSEEFLALQQKVVGQLTPQDKEKLNQYSRAQNETEQRLQRSRAETEEALQGDMIKNRNKAFKDVRDAVAKVARDKGVTLVLESQFAWYAETDLTEDALKVLNKK
ncbi:MAG: hypothetical protein RMJ43_09270 [Chloroherpetonaceae bacterium]|nr:hypothetical protein [Chthonomonadaceae bacterium]MDW8208013.1 hypothetical protein [Chloroherpetonaceae bacterium]